MAKLSKLFKGSSQGHMQDESQAGVINKLAACGSKVVQSPVHGNPQRRQLTHCTAPNLLKFIMS